MIKDFLHSRTGMVSAGLLLLAVLAFGGSLVTPVKSPAPPRDPGNAPVAALFSPSPSPGAVVVQSGPAELSGVDVVIKLLLVLGVIYLASLGLKRILPATLSTGGNGRLRVVERAPLSQGTQLVLVTLDDTTLLLGVTNHEVSLLVDATPASTSADLFPLSVQREDKPTPTKDATAGSKP